MQSEQFIRLLALEQCHTERFQTSLPTGRALDTKCLVDMLVQRRLVSLDLFTWTLDRMICALELDEAREVAMGILREEYSGLNHRYAFLMEIESLGIPRKEIIRQRPSAVTQTTMERIRQLVHALETGAELDRLIFLRYFAEVLPAHEFGWIMSQAQKACILTRETSKFLWPHVEFDSIGRGGDSHAQRYLPLIEQLLQTAEEWKAATMIIRHAADIRIIFYSQFS